MAKVHLDRIKQKYGWTGGKYRALMAMILERQSEGITRKVATIQKGKLDKHARTASKRLGVTLTVPDITDVLPQRSVFVRKGAERGKLLTDALRTQLTRQLREVVVKYISDGKGTMQGRTGVERGRMKPELVDTFERRIKSVFAGYAKRDPEIGGVPRNVSVIATTEVRAAINEIKHTYNAALATRNPATVQMVKKWIHHPELSEEPRPGHAAVSGKTVPIADQFRVPVYERLGSIKSGPNKGKPRWRRTRQFVAMLHPHDPTAPIEEVASCNCELDYQMEIAALTGKEQGA